MFSNVITEKGEEQFVVISNADYNKIVRSIGVKPNSFFALKSLSNLLEGSLFKSGLLVMLGYLIFQSIYFLLTRTIYK